jgi:hypothetical protein
MSLGEMFLAGLIAAAAMIALLAKMNLKRLIRFDIFLDILLTSFFIFAFAGTFMGMMAGLWAGLIISIFLWFMKKSMPREELKLVKTSSFPYRKFMWVQVINRR